MHSRDLGSSRRSAVRHLSALVVTSALFLACGGIDGPPDTVGQREHRLVEKIVMLPSPGRTIWGALDWDCQPGYEDRSCPAPGHPGCTVGDVDDGNCVCIWDDYCEPFFD